MISDEFGKEWDRKWTELCDDLIPAHKIATAFWDWIVGDVLRAHDNLLEMFKRHEKSMKVDPNLTTDNVISRTSNELSEEDNYKLRPGARLEYPRAGNWAAYAHLAWTEREDKDGKYKESGPYKGHGCHRRDDEIQKLFDSYRKRLSELPHQAISIESWPYTVFQWCWNAHADERARRNSSLPGSPDNARAIPGRYGTAQAACPQGIRCL